MAGPSTLRLLGLGACLLLGLAVGHPVDNNSFLKQADAEAPLLGIRRAAARMQPSLRASDMHQTRGEPVPIEPEQGPLSPVPISPDVGPMMPVPVEAEDPMSPVPIKPPVPEVVPNEPSQMAPARRLR
uniref:Uncharacterized protein n=1 Tax=Alexandrium andersonii TaxID=327968 RepID=A0A7S2F107_9DINO|mmetsp:Transcript_12184/g.27671  ORF Transcript_12184/g.27671 Transcript_12184/m.27671 type:complete len:128 (+) Transcript_12184:56-439(+)